MKIGIDALYIRPGKNGGTESYLRNILKGLEKIDDSNEYYIFTSTTNSFSFEFSNKKFIKVECKVNSDNKLERVLYSSFRLPQKIRELNIEVMFFPTYIRSLGSLKGIPTISNLHDIQYKHYPEYFSKMQKIIFDIFYSTSLKKSDRVVCISEHVKSDLIKNFPYINQSKYEAIHNSIDFEKLDSCTNLPVNTLEQKFGLKSHKYILSVAALSPHKNIDTLIDAFAKFKEIDEDEIKLVLVGVRGKSADDLIKKISEHKYKLSVIIPGYIEDDVLSLLYDQAALFISTSLFEGFGMPPVEAMYKKIPTITTRCTSLPEVTKNKAIYYEDAFNSSELASLIHETIIKPLNTQELIDTSNELKSSYSLEIIASKYKSMFENVYSKKKTR